ncbi:MAG TPA: D-2-hydroxyacid dehydrogenase family protein [Gammaproteobacteria bacterium]|nr:D-2-hydroxyacid dehydrogenase family protein [Gammaproteobacteria bacterium]
MKKLAILDDYEGAALARAERSKLDGKVDVSVFRDHLDDEAAVAERLADFEIVFLMRERTPFPESLIARLPKLELLITSGKRNASIDLDAATRHGVVVTGTPILPYPAAEHAWAMILALAKRIPADDQRMRLGRWGEGLNLGLQEKTLGVIGLGKLGSQVARVGLAFGMNVVAWSHNLTAERCAEVGVGLVSKEALLSSADFVTIHLVLGERSRGLIGAPEFGLMKSSAYLINTSRGPIVDEVALVEALRSGRIAGAGLDVFETEPLPGDHPLRALSNTVLTPHQGYVTRENFAIFYETAIDNIVSWLEGEPANVLNS